MRTAILLTLTSALAIPTVWSQKLELKFEHLKAKASESTEVDLDGPALELALKAGMKHAVKAAKSAKELKELTEEDVAKIVAGVKGVYVRNFEFAKAGEYTDADVDSVLKQVSGAPGWSRIVSVREQHERTEVHISTQNEQVSGVLVVVAEPQELTVVNVVGTIAMDKLRELVSSTMHFDLKNLPGQTTKHQEN